MLDLIMDIIHSPWAEWFGIFLGVIALDYIWGKYIQETAGTDAHRAAFWSVLVYVVGGYVTISYVRDWWLLIPASLGAYLGTFLSVKFKK